MTTETKKQKAASLPTEPLGSFCPRLLGSAAFAKKKYDRSWLIESVLVSKQPAVIGGPQKCLKTSLVVDMAISLGTATPFLNFFKVPEAKRVAVFSGESGDAVIQDLALRVAKSKGVDLPDADVLWSFNLPKLSLRSDLNALNDLLSIHEIDVAMIDPLYLCLLDGSKRSSAANLFEIGPILRDAAEACLKAGTTPIFVHHMTKGASDSKNTVGLDKLSYAGTAEFARQWVLLGRQEEFLPGSGRHKLVMVTGAAAGHSGRWDLDVDEGVLPGGRHWRPNVQPARFKSERN